MFQIWLYSLSSVIIVSLISLIGVFTLTIKDDILKKLLIFFVSSSAGVLLGDAFFHIFPEIINQSGYTIKLGFLLILGIFIFFMLEKYIHWHHCHETNNPEHLHHLGMMNLFGDGLHNFLDGLIIAASYLVSIPLGLASTLAIVAHEIPQEISDFGVLLHSGFTKKKALLYNLLSALVAVVGTVLGLFLRNGNFRQILLPIAAAGFIYIATADLIPELHKETKISRSLLQLFSFIFGIFIMYLFTFYEN
ncbi:MAG: ZIP family metal transporter [Candidatus Komeilibacteria bacterium]|nr:ZIP family metal transporter [Candidatus Komeilibacteria bacterium]